MSVLANSPVPHNASLGYRVWDKRLPGIVLGTVSACWLGSHRDSMSCIRVCASSSEGQRARMRMGERRVATRMRRCPDVFPKARRYADPDQSRIDEKLLADAI